MDMYGFYTGKEFEAYKTQGAHLENGGVRFCTFAPAAYRVAVIGDFNGWQEWNMNPTNDGNFYEIFIPEAKEGQMYKYRIYTGNDSYTDHCDPYGFGMELRPANASIIRNMNSYRFQDEAWMNNRKTDYTKPVNIYEMHAGSWKNNSEDENGWYTYEVLAEKLVPYLKENGYNYVEFLPLTEHPCDESWGYQNTGFFAPTARYGTAEQLKKMVDYFHQNGIGVIMDFVPVHFAIDSYALAKYDGSCLYEYPSNDVGVSEWGSHNFMHSRGEVRSFLQSSANFWLAEFHFDGIRMDAISNIIYWLGDPARGVNGNAVDFIRTMNAGLKERHPGCLLMAEDSTNYAGVTKSAHEGGLGFDYKWDMGWMNDTLSYFQTSPEYRSKDYHKLTVSMMYYYDERFLLPLSHDEVVHGKATILQKMNGDYENKFPQARAFYMYLYAHPGKKLNFMGNELGQLREWDEKREQDWDILQYPVHDGFHRFMKRLNTLYLEHPALYKGDFEKEGFQWLDCSQEEKVIYVMERRAVHSPEKLVAVFNFSDKMWKDYSFPVEDVDKLELLLSSEEECYGGIGAFKQSTLKVENGKVTLDVPPMCGLYFQGILSH